MHQRLRRHRQRRPLPASSGGHYNITSYYDRYSGYIKSVAAKCVDAFTTSVNFVLHWVCTFGPPNSILTVNGSDFRSELFYHLSEMLDTTHKFIVAYQARTNGAVKRFNEVLKKMLRVTGMKKGLDFANSDSWHLYVPVINAIHNNRLSRRTRLKLCPNDIMLGRSIPTIIDWRLNLSNDLLSSQRFSKLYKRFVENVHQIRDALEKNNKLALAETQLYNAVRKKSYDEKSYDERCKIHDVLPVGEYVKYFSTAWPVKGSKRLEIHWTGPFQILASFNDGKNYLVQHFGHKQLYFIAPISRLSSVAEPDVTLHDPAHEIPSAPRPDAEYQPLLTSEPEAPAQEDGGLSLVIEDESESDDDDDSNNPSVIRANELMRQQAQALEDGGGTSQPVGAPAERSNDVDVGADEPTAEASPAEPDGANDDEENGDDTTVVMDDLLDVDVTDSSGDESAFQI